MDTFYLNTATIAGVVSDYGVRTTFQDNGAQRTAFAVQVKEAGFDEKVRSVFLDITAWGRAAEAAGVLEPGQPGLIEGKLVRTKQAKTKGSEREQWYTTVQALRIQPLDEEAP
jgi:single-stranded DNA-binding protein